MAARLQPGKQVYHLAFSCVLKTLTFAGLGGDHQSVF